MSKLFRKITLQSSYRPISYACLLFLSACSQQFRLTSMKTEQGIEVREDGRTVLFYQAKPKSLGGNYERAGYVHPLYNLDGNVITEDFPDDHPHHHGIYSAWHQILIKDVVIGDGWTGKNISWEVTGTAVESGKKEITVRAETLWKAWIDGGKMPIVKEHLKMTVHASNAQYRIIDYDFKLVPLKDNLRIGGSDDEKGYGGFSLRIKLPDDIRFMSQGMDVEPQVVAVDAGPWMDFSGSFDGTGHGKSGILVLCHPSNPGSRQPWILRRKNSMQNAVFPGRTPVALRQEGLSFRYRLVIHRNVLDQHTINEMYRAYAAI